MFIWTSNLDILHLLGKSNNYMHISFGYYIVIVHKYLPSPSSVASSKFDEIIKVLWNWHYIIKDGNQAMKIKWKSSREMLWRKRKSGRMWLGDLSNVHSWKTEEMALTWHEIMESIYTCAHIKRVLLYLFICVCAFFFFKLNIHYSGSTVPVPPTLTTSLFPLPW